MAHGHAHAIAVWAGVRALLGAGGDGGHLPAGYADALHAAARAAGDHTALHCPGPRP